jgi:sugar O-acyltransferase (sialic acid O-acetyltransferase NeuD family)
MALLAKQCGHDVLGWIDKVGFNERILHIDDAWNRFPDASVVLGVGYPNVRRKLVEQVLGKGWSLLRRLIHPSVILSDSVECGVGTVLTAGVIATVNVTLGQHVHVNLGSSISHDVWIGDYVTISPGARLCGNVHIEDDVFVGAGATIIQGVTLGKGCMIGAGACVTKSVPAGETWVGVPARQL